MSVFTLKPNHHLAVPYTAPFFGATHVEVESEFLISVLVVDEPNLALWRAVKYYQMFAGAADTQRFSQDLFLPSRAVWYLVMANFSPMLQTAVHYTVR